MSAPAHVDILQHALGLSADPHGTNPRARTITRNNFCAYIASGTDPNAAACESLCEAGLMSRGRLINEGQDRYYHATEAGKAAALAALPPPPKLTASQRRYQQFLEEDSGLRFGEWLQELRRRSRDARSEGLR